MRITWQRDTDMAYLYLKEHLNSGEVAQTVICDDDALSGMVNIDLDSSGRIVGIEVSCASAVLPSELLGATETEG